MLSINSNNLILENTKPESIKELSKYNVFNKSFMEEALEYASMVNDQIRMESRNLYFAIKESESEKETKSAYQKFSAKLSLILIKFYAFLARLNDKFMAKISMIFNSDKFVMKHKDMLFLLDSEFEYESYQYTNLDDDKIPKVDLYDLEDFTKSILAKLDENASFLESDNQSTSLSIKGYSLNDNDFYDRFRNSLINNSEGKISQEDFNQELFKCFRDTGEKRKLTISRHSIKDIFHRFADYKKMFENVKSLRTKTENGYKKLQKDIQKMIEVEDGRLVVSDINPNMDIKEDSLKYNKLKTIIQSCLTKINKMTTIHSLAFGAKLDALMERYKDDRKILSKAILTAEKDLTDSVEKDFKTESLTLDNIDIYDDFLIEGFVNGDIRQCLSNDFDKLCEFSNYSLFLMREANEQSFMLDYINNEILGESSIQLGFVNEAGLFNKLNNTITRILKFIAKLWGKFMEFFDKVFKSDKKYLDKYKDIILKKPFKDAEIEMNDYNNTGAVRAITDIRIKPFRYDELKSLTGSKDEMKSAYLAKEPYSKFMEDETQSVANNFLKYYSGKKINVNTKSLNRTDMFNYIYSYTDMVKTLKQELYDFQKQADNAKAYAKKFGGSEATQESFVSETKEINNSAKDKLSKLLEDYFNEDIKIDSTNGNEAKVPDQNTMPGNNTATTNPEEEQDKENRVNNNGESIKQDESEQREILDRIEVYFTSAQGIIQGKLNLSKNIYNDYFKIIQWHVRQYVGTEKKETFQNDKTPPQKGEDFSLRNNI